MRVDKRIALNRFIPILAAYDVNHWRAPEECLKTIWHGFKKACLRKHKPLHPQTVLSIEERGWMSPKQAEMFCEYAGIPFPK